MFGEKVLASRYLLIKKLAAGSFGKTYLAEDIMLPGNPKCVVKKLNPIFNDSQLLDIAKRLFETEAKILQKLGDRQKIPQLLAYFTEKQEFYLVQQYIEGPSLSEKLIPGKPWSEIRVIKLLQNCLNILDYIHSQGVIHRDVKPGNLICRQQDNRLFLVDFGAVKEVILNQSRLLSSTVAIGTRGYMPEEQARGKPRFNSDIYALGVIAIEALIGCSPLDLQEDEERELIWQQQAKVSPRLGEILSKMTRYNFKERYQSASEVIEAIDHFTNNSSLVQPNIGKYYDSTVVEKVIYNSVVNKPSPVIREDSPPSKPIANSTQSKSNLPPQTLEKSSSKTDTNNDLLNPELIAFCQQQLAKYIGPLSDFVVKDVLTKNPQITLQQLIERLASEIPDSRKAKQFTTILKKSSSKTDTNNDFLNPELIAFCQEQLAKYIGPLSDFVVKDVLTKNPQITLQQLIERLAAEIPDSRKAQQFTTILKKSSSKTDTNHDLLNPELIALCQQELAKYIGPLSNFIVKDILTKNPQINLQQLIDRLAAEIPDSRKAKQFKKNLLGRI